MHQNVSLGSNGLDWFCSLQTILMRFRGTDFCTSSARFAPSFTRQPNIPNAPKWYEMHQNISLGSNGVDRVPSLQKIPTRQTAPNAPKWYKTHQNIILGSNGVDRVRSLRNIPTRLRGTNFCTSSARFAPRFVGKPNGLHPNSMKCSKMSVLGTMGWIGCVRCEKFRHDFVARTFALVRLVLHRVSYGNQTVPNAPKWYKTHQNVRLGSNGFDRVCSLRKIPMRLRGTNFCTSSARFAPSFERQPNVPERTQIV